MHKSVDNCVVVLCVIDYISGNEQDDFVLNHFVFVCCKMLAEQLLELAMSYGNSLYAQRNIERRRELSIPNKWVDARDIESLTGMTAGQFSKKLHSRKLKGLANPDHFIVGRHKYYYNRAQTFQLLGLKLLNEPQLTRATKPIY